MYARITTFQSDPSRLQEMTSKFDELKEQVKAIAGVVAVYSAWRADGKGVTTAIYESQEAAEASVPQVKAIWGGLSDFLTGAPNVEAYENVENLTA
ncbi:MAG: hypothetical protein ACTSX7_13395 [Alphaproteobacteria bacterium]